MKKLLYVIVCMPLLTDAQGGKGIYFEQKLNWQQVLDQAQKENKYIFVDCYTTWCQPCKAMDKDVYSLEKVGAFLNEKFISVKVQMDTSKNDNEQEKSWYGDAHKIQQQYKIDGYPTYLFLSPEGKLVYRDVGYKIADDFIRLAHYASDTASRYYALLENYKKGRKDYTIMPSLALTANKLKDTDWATTIARDYYNNYLNNLQDTAFYTKENIEFIRWFSNLIHSKDRVFHLLYHKGKKIDETIDEKGFSEQLVTSIIIKEEIADRLCRNDRPVVEQPDWDKIKNAISKKYSAIDANSLVESIRFDYHTMYYKSWGKWRQYAKVIEEKIKQYPPKQGGKNLNFLGDTWGLNVAAWDVFEHCNDKLVLTKALQWIEMAIQLEQPPNHQYYDTKANLLYKLGKVKEAIAWEEIAIALDNAYAIKNGKEKGILVDTYYAFIDKMKKGEPTWKVGQQN